jgi:hypothetical protein
MAQKMATNDCCRVQFRVQFVCIPPEIRLQMRKFSCKYDAAFLHEKRKKLRNFGAFPILRSF